MLPSPTFAMLSGAALLVGVLLSVKSFADARRGTFRTRRVAVLAMLSGAALFVGAFLLLRSFTRLRLTVILGLLVAVVLLHRAVLVSMQPFASHRLVRELLILRSLLPALICASLFLLALPPTSAYAPWVLLAGTVLFFVIVRPRIRNLKASIRKGDRRSEKPE